jgi:tetratricopeptide (TPR) repeat protein
MSDTYLHPPADPEIAAIVAKLADGLQDLPQTIAQCRDQLEQGYSLGELRGITKTEYESLYKIAHDLCNKGEFHHALPIALQLTLHHPIDSRFPFIAGSCLQRLGHTEAATLMYALTIDIDAEHAAAAYRLGECLIATEKPIEAIPFLNKAIELCYGHFEKRQLMALARATLENLLP